ncbi:hypothetical protein BDA96_08G032200 [Sorghum bicolor]|uniref:RING-type domain-containing protein n=1 Tax=Sorghum bicolor TaxID=4558 RepID=A0A921QDX2_SORBI|nr:hypothetical protein BDA96_08G032200 [Sorghum bicolor]
MMPHEPAGRSTQESVRAKPREPPAAMSDTSSSPPPEQVLLLPTDRSSSSSSSDDSHDGDDDSDLVIAIATHRQTYGEEEEAGQRRRAGRGRSPIMAMPPAPALFAPWVVVRGGGAAPAPAASIEALPTVEVSEPGAVCAICKDDLPLAAAARRLPCGHLYHSSCIVPWLEVHNSCPICRCRLPSENTGPAAGEVPPAPASEQDPPPAAARTDLQVPAQAVSGEGEETIILPSV